MRSGEKLQQETSAQEKLIWCWGIPSSAWRSLWFSLNTTGYAHTLIIISPPKTPKTVFQCPLYFLNAMKDHAFCPGNCTMKCWPCFSKLEAFVLSKNSPLPWKWGMKWWWKADPWWGASLLHGWGMLLFCCCHRFWPYNTSSAASSWPAQGEGLPSLEISGIALYHMHPPLDQPLHHMCRTGDIVPQVPAD